MWKVQLSTLHCFFYHEKEFVKCGDVRQVWTPTSHGPQRLRVGSDITKIRTEDHRRAKSVWPKRPTVRIGKKSPSDDMWECDKPCWLAQAFHPWTALRSLLKQDFGLSFNSDGFLLDEFYVSAGHEMCDSHKGSGSHKRWRWEESHDLQNRKLQLLRWWLEIPWKWKLLHVQVGPMHRRKLQLLL